MARSSNIQWLFLPLLIVACVSDESKLRSRADLGDAEAQYQLASMYWEGNEVEQDRNEALKWYQRAAQHGHLGAQLRIADAYEAGQGVSQDYLRASQWYERAAEQGDEAAQVHLARLYLKGAGVPQNYLEAVKLLERAAGGKNAEAQYLLGRIYWEGRAVPRDLVQAHMWFNLSAAQGHPKAASMRQVAATEMDQKQLVEAQRLAVEQGKSK